MLSKKVWFWPPKIIWSDTEHVQNMSKYINGKNAKTGVGWQAADTRPTATDTTRCEESFYTGFAPRGAQKMPPNPDFLKIPKSRIADFPTG